SASPRVRATSSGGNSRAGTVSRASEPDWVPPSGTKVTLTSWRPMARMVAAVTRRNSSSGVVSLLMRGISAGGGLVQLGLAAGGLQFGAHAALVVLGHGRAFDLVALVEEGEAEG